MSLDISPPPNTIVHFMAAIGVVRSYRFSEKPISQASSSHGAQTAILLNNGYILIDQAWGRRPEEKPKMLSEDEVEQWKRERKRK